MNFLLSAGAPNDMWVVIINWIHGAVANYGWTILLFTLLVKLVMSPLDFMVKYSSKKQALIQKKCAPEIAKLNKKYGSDQNTVKVQTQSLYKREGLKTGIGCLIMAINMILTMVVFFTLYSSLRKVSAYQAINQYETIQTSYSNSYYQNLIDADAEDEIVDRETADVWMNSVHDRFTNADSGLTWENTWNNWCDGLASDGSTLADNAEENSLYQKISSAVQAGSDSAIQTWNDIKESWLWIDNIWVADAVKKPFPTYSDLLSLAQNGNYTTYVKENINEADYNNIANLIGSHSRSSNGYFILAILAGVLTFLSQWLAELHNGLKNKKANKLAKVSEKATGNSMKIMKIILPIIMVIFVLTTGSSFGIYIISSSIASIIYGEIITLIIDAMTKKKRIEVEEYLEKEANRLIRKGKLQG